MMWPPLPKAANTTTCMDQEGSPGSSIFPIIAAIPARQKGRRPATVEEGMGGGMEDRSRYPLAQALMARTGRLSRSVAAKPALDAQQSWDSLVRDRPRVPEGRFEHWLK